MDLYDIQYRDHVLRAYFRGRNWDKNSEYELKCRLVQNSQELLPQYKYVVEDEWEVIFNQSQCGRGDLVFTDGNGRFAIVEVKWIDLSNSTRKGTTRRTSNTKKRRKVEAQATDYAKHYASFAELDITKEVEAFIFTNECDHPRKIEDL